jgi:diacylglycerol kinase (ATP)
MVQNEPAASRTTTTGSGAFSWAERLNSVRYAVRGIGFMLRTQHNAWIHLGATVAVCATGRLVRLSAADWRWVTTAVILVWVAETMNTAFEYVCDVVSPEFHVSVERAKDIAAGAVLICASGSVVIGSLTFWPYLLANAAHLRRAQAATARPPRRSSSQTMIEPLSRFQARPLAKAAR